MAVSFKLVKYVLFDPIEVSWIPMITLMEKSDWAAIFFNPKILSKLKVNWIVKWINGGFWIYQYCLG